MKYKGIREDLLSLKRLWPYFTENKRYIYFSLFLVPFIALVNALIPYLFKRGIDDGIILGETETLYWVGAMYFLLVTLNYLLRTGQAIMAAVAVNRMIMHLRNALAQHILRLKAAYHDKTLSGALATRTTGDFDNLSASLDQGILSAIVDIAVLLGCLLGMFALNIKLSLVVLSMLLIGIWAINFFSQKLKKAMLRARKKVAAANAYVQECMQGSNTLKVLNAQEESQRRYFSLNEEARKAQIGSVNVDALMFSVIEGISSIAIGVVLWTSLKWFGVSSELFSGLSLGIIVAFIQYVQSLFEPLKSLGSRMAMIQGVFTAIERIFGILDIKDFISGDKEPQFDKGCVEFDNVSFCYDLSEMNYILKRVSFTVPQGSSIALVGPTGGGKSTIIKLLSKLYDGYEGDILLDKQNLKEIEPFLLRREIAIVPQEITLFTGSLSFNISMGDSSIPLEDIKAAACVVGLDQIVEELPGQWEFEVKEQGGNLSHGQRQLIVFARALVKRPKIIILDEATSSVDPESEKLVQDAISLILQGRTVIVIAHRLSTIEECDQILLIKGGEIAERGTHKELLAQKRHYYDMYTSASS